MTYFRLHAFWKSQVTNLKIDVIHRSVGDTSLGIGRDFFLPSTLPAIAEVQPIEKPRARRRHLRFEDRTSPKLVLNTQNCKRCDHRDSIKTSLHHTPAAML